MYGSKVPGKVDRKELGLLSHTAARLPDFSQLVAVLSFHLNLLGILFTLM
jgi:hypothetical protein